VTKGRSVARLDFLAEAHRCALCGASLGIVRSKTRTIATYAEGVFEAREFHKVCAVDRSHPVRRSEALARLVRPRQRFGYDLIVQVGLARYLREKQREEIRDELFRRRRIELSAATVSHLCDRFLIYLEVLHQLRAPELRAAMQVPGYPMHIDATSEHGKGGLFVCLDGFRGWVLTAGKIPSESERHLKPFVDKTLTLFGDPIATVRDLGPAGQNAVRHLKQRGVPDFVCHYHFLGAVGEKLFDKPYTLLRNLLRQSHLRTDLRQLLKDLRQDPKSDTSAGRGSPDRLREELLALVYWVLEGDGKQDARYPFSLPHLAFFQRCRDTRRRAELWVPTPRSQAERQALRRLASLVRRLEKDQRFADAVGQLETGWQAFCEARDVLRLTHAELPGGDQRSQPVALPALQAKRLDAIEKATAGYLDELRQRVGNESLVKPHTPAAIILKYFNRYRDRLFGHPVIRDEDGTVIAVVERTNNTAEHFFGGEKQHLRRRLGRAHLGRDLEDQPAQAALAANLRLPDYVRLLCGSLDNLHHAFANLDEQALDEATTLVRSHRDSALQQQTRTLLEHLNEPPISDGGKPTSA
jgi:hypothetical protein